jgi:3-deoxy-7-phosphoheptulonate synthase
MSMAALVAGAQGLEIEVHVDPPSALSDKEQQLTPAEFSALMRKLERLSAFMAGLRAEAGGKEAKI